MGTRGRNNSRRRGGISFQQNCGKSRTTFDSNVPISVIVRTIDIVFENKVYVVNLYTDRMGEVLLDGTPVGIIHHKGKKVERSISNVSTTISKKAWEHILNIVNKDIEKSPIFYIDIKNTSQKITLGDLMKQFNKSSSINEGKKTHILPTTIKETGQITFLPVEIDTRKTTTEKYKVVIEGPPGNAVIAKILVEISEVALYQSKNKEHPSAKAQLELCKELSEFGCSFILPYSGISKNHNSYEFSVTALFNKAEEKTDKSSDVHRAFIKTVSFFENRNNFEILQKLH